MLPLLRKPLVWQERILQESNLSELGIFLPRERMSLGDIYDISRLLLQRRLLSILYLREGRPDSVRRGMSVNSILSGIIKIESIALV